MSNIIDTHGLDQEAINAQRQRGGRNLTWIMVVAGTLMVLALPTMIILFFGMLPTMVAFIVDRTKGKSATFTVCGINFIGTFPYIMSLWTEENTIDAAMSMLDIFTLLVMYSSAAFGWMLFMTAPPIISSFVEVMHQRKIATLRAQQKSLIDEWGPTVADLVEGDKFDEDHMPHTPTSDDEKDDAQT